MLGYIHPFISFGVEIKMCEKNVDRCWNVYWLLNSIQTNLNRLSFWTMFSSNKNDLKWVLQFSEINIYIYPENIDILV